MSTLGFPAHQGDVCLLALATLLGEYALRFFAFVAFRMLNPGREYKLQLAPLVMSMCNFFHIAVNLYPLSSVFITHLTFAFTLAKKLSTG
jgi:hypothetical protein